MGQSSRNLGTTCSYGHFGCWTRIRWVFYEKMTLWSGSEEFSKMAAIFGGWPTKLSISWELFDIESWFLCQTICFTGQGVQIYKFHCSKTTFYKHTVKMTHFNVKLEPTTILFWFFSNIPYTVHSAKIRLENRGNNSVANFHWSKGQNMSFTLNFYFQFTEYNLEFKHCFLGCL